MNISKVIAIIKSKSLSFSPYEAKLALDYFKNDRDLVHKWLNERGTWRSLLSDAEVLNFRSLGDGIGKDLKDVNWIMCLDHISSSSDEAIKNIADNIRQWVVDRTTEI